MSLPATDKFSRAAGDLLRAHHFIRTDTVGYQEWCRASGAFLVRVMISPSGAAALRLSLRGDGGHHGPPRPWSVELPLEPWPIAVEAVWFVCVIEGLTPPNLGGRLDRNGTTQPGRTR